MKKALYMDMDGTIIVTKSGDKFPRDKTDWEYKDGVIAAIERYVPDVIVIVTNQGGIESGFVVEEELVEKLKNIAIGINKLTGIKVVYDYCPAMDKSNYFRKPNPGMAYTHIIDQEISIAESTMIGDASDVFEVIFTSHDDARNFEASIGKRAIEVRGPDGNGYYTVKVDSFSNSDRAFAKNAGIGKYYDVEEFIIYNTDVKAYIK